MTHNEAMERIAKLAQESIDELMAINSASATAEAIAIAIGQLKNKEGKLLRVQLSDSPQEYIELCFQIAKQILTFSNRNANKNPPCGRVF